MRFIINILVLIVLILTSCNSPFHFKKDKSINRLEIKQNDIFSISLNSNFTTGYYWMIGSGSDTTCISLINKEYKSKSSSEIPALGAGGKEIWQFRATKKGKNSLLFYYVRSWENKTPIDSVKYVIKIK